MLIWKLTKTINNSEEAAWENLTRDYLGDDIHPKRKEGFLLSREALRMALSEIGVTAKISELQLKKDSYHQIESFPHFTLSLSHCLGWGAAMLGEHKKFKAIGIDIEPESRVVKAMIMQRITNPQDISLANIQTWSLKEACFKALMNTGSFEKPVEFSSILLEQNKWSHSSGMTGEWELHFQNELVIALAWIRN